MPNGLHFFENQVLQRFCIDDYLTLMNRLILHSAQFGNPFDTRGLMRVKIFFECNEPSLQIFRDSLAVDLISGSSSDERFLCSNNAVTDDAFIISVIKEFRLLDEVVAAGHDCENGRIVCFNGDLYEDAVNRFYAHFEEQDENGDFVNRFTVFMDSVSDEEADEEISQLTVVAPRLRLL